MAATTEKHSAQQRRPTRSRRLRPRACWAPTRLSGCGRATCWPPRSRSALRRCGNPRWSLEQEAALVRELIAVLSVAARTAQPPQGDKRFADPAWQDNTLYRVTLQGYMAWRNALAGFVERSALDPKTKERAQFVMSLFTDALSPTNTLLGNPAALKKIVDSGGASLLGGMKNLMTDLLQNQGMPAQVDKTAFEVGKNLGHDAGRGGVSQRSAGTDPVRAGNRAGVRPPATDRAAADQQVLCVRSVGRQEHRRLSGQERVPGVRRELAQPDRRAARLGAWIPMSRALHRSHRGGARHHRQRRRQSARRLLRRDDDLRPARPPREPRRQDRQRRHADGRRARQHRPSRNSVCSPRRKRSRRPSRTAPRSGVLDGEEMGRVFAWMRPNDLVWNYWVNNYLLGKTPPAFDILYWNNDTTRLPAKLHGQLLDIFTGNLFCKPRALTVLGTPIDLSEVTCDKYVVAGITDHITPWKGVYNTARTFGGNTRFVLSSSGHIQSLINPPGNPKAKFFVNPDPALPASADAWLAAAQPEKDSWWNNWRDWLATRSGERRAAPASPGNERHPSVAQGARHLRDGSMTHPIGRVSRHRMTAHIFQRSFLES